MPGVSFTVAGRPYTKNTKRWNPRAGRIYITREALDYQDRITGLALQARAGYETPTAVTVSTGGKPLPRATAQAIGDLARTALRWPVDTGTFRVTIRVFVPRTAVIDVDNVAKPVLDGCKGVLWHDDRQRWIRSLTVQFEDVDVCGERTEVSVTVLAAAPAQERLA